MEDKEPQKGQSIASSSIVYEFQNSTSSHQNVDSDPGQGSEAARDVESSDGEVVLVHVTVGIAEVKKGTQDHYGT